MVIQEENCVGNGSWLYVFGMVEGCVGIYCKDIWCVIGIYD